MRAAAASVVQLAAAELSTASAWSGEELELLGWVLRTCAQIGARNDALTQYVLAFSRLLLGGHLNNHPGSVCWGAHQFGRRT